MGRKYHTIFFELSDYSKLEEKLNKFQEDEPTWRLISLILDKFQIGFLSVWQELI